MIVMVGLVTEKSEACSLSCVACGGYMERKTHFLESSELIHLLSLVFTKTSFVMQDNYDELGVSKREVCTSGFLQIK